MPIENLQNIYQLKKSTKKRRKKEIIKKMIFLKIYYYLRRSVRYFSHNFLKCGCFLSLFLIVQSDFLAKFPRISHYRLSSLVLLLCLFILGEWIFNFNIFFRLSFDYFFMYSTFHNCTYYSRLTLYKRPNHMLNSFAIAFKFDCTYFDTNALHLIMFFCNFTR